MGTILIQARWTVRQNSIFIGSGSIMRLCAVFLFAFLLTACGGAEAPPIEGAFGYFFGEKHSVPAPNNVTARTFPYYVEVPPKTNSPYFKKITLVLNRKERIVEIGAQSTMNSREQAESAFTDLKDDLLSRYPGAIVGENAVDIISGERTILLRLETESAGSSLTLIHRAGDLAG